MNELSRRSAVEIVDLLRHRAISPHEVIDAAEERISEVEPAINALPTTCFDRARDRADRLPTHEAPPWHLAGLPVAVKDLDAVAGVRTTQGSVLHAHDVPERSDVMVETLETNGALVVAKSNTPEFGAGSHTFNDVFGRTHNPWDRSRSPGGSSGGTAAALATGEVWLGTGSDLGGSLRNPASFCGVVGIRPSPGRVARAPVPRPWDTLSVRGPMARSVADAALMLDAMVGHSAEDPISLDRPAELFLDAARRPERPRRVAVSFDLGGITPVDAAVARVCRDAAERMASLGAEVEEATVDLREAARVFHVLRALGYVADHLEHVARLDEVKEEIRWNISAGLELDPAEIAAAEMKRAELYSRAVEFFERYDVLVCPAAIVPPFPGEWRWPHDVAGVSLEQYIDWLVICSAISVTSCPVVALPAGSTTEGLPVGVQFVGPPRSEHRLLSTAAWWEQANPYAGMVPRDPAP